MKKQLRKLLSALLVLTMLLSALPMGVFAEEDHVPAVVDELTEEGTKELDAEPTIELNEELTAEPTEEPIDDALETATAGEPETEPEKEPAAEPTVAPIVDSIDDALETATAGEPKTEPEKEPEAAPAAEDEADEVKPEETPAPAENADDDPLSGLTDEQRKTLSSLPEGFSADVVAFAMLRSTGCAHTLLKVGEDSDSESYTSIDSKKHLFTQKNLSRKLFCSACGEVLQTIELGDVEEEWSHSWYSDGNTGGSLFDFTCLDCDEKITINPPCSHGSYSLNKNRTPYCTECGAIAYPGESMTMDDLCKHTHYTVHYPNTKLTEYSRWNDASHLKTTKVAQYTDDSESSQYYPAVCNDCGADLVYLPSGKVEQLEGYDGELWGDMEYVQTASDFEAHTFANGVCKYCGEKQSEETCQHTETKRVENTGKRTTKLTSLNDTEHEVTTTKYYELHCATCDAYISDDGTDTTTDKQSHDFGSGNTCACGYTKTEETCQHTETKRVENTGKRTTKLTSLNETEHEVTTTKYYELHCAVCDAYISDDGEDTTTEKQSHDFSSGTTCACGYMKAQETCQHVNVSVESYPERTYTKLDEKKHICTLVFKTRELYCHDCERTLQTISYNKTFSVEVEHDWLWAGSMGGSIYDFICDACDTTITLTPPCSHGSFQNSDADGLLCTVCGKQFGPYVDDGPVNECKHTSYTIIYPGVEETRYDQWNADSHLKKTMVSYYVDDDTTWGYDATCNDCGANLIYENGKIDDTIYSGRSGVDYKSIKSVFEAHSFVDGVCEHCGEKQTDESCQHKETKRVENTDKRTTELKSLSETEHEVATTKYYELHCAACDAYISDDGTDTTTEKQPHDFSSGNTCACGYVKAEEPCQHTETKRVENTGKRTSELKPFSETEHEVTTTKYYELHCAACDAYISDDGTDSTTEKQSHDFGSGTTCACGYVKAVEPSGKSVIKNVSISANAKACVEKVGGETFAVTVTCNLDTVCVEMYFGKEHNQNTYRDSSDYVETNGNRIFKMTYTLGGDGKSYAGEYPISVRPFSYVDRADWKNNQMGEEVKITLKVTHDNEVVDRIVKDAYEHTANGHTKIQNITTVLKCKVCGATDKQVANKSVGAEEAHTLDANDKCSVCGYKRSKSKGVIVHGELVTDAWGADKIGQIRAMRQNKFDGSQIKSIKSYDEYWGNVNGLDKCNRAAASMALSYMGVDVLPKDFRGESSVEGTNGDTLLKEKGVHVEKAKKKTIEEFERMYDRYENDVNGTFSPILIYTKYMSYDKNTKKPKQSNHWLTVYDRDPEDDGWYCVLDPGFGDYARIRFEEDETGNIYIAEFQYKKSEKGEWQTSERYGPSIKKEHEFDYSMMKIIQYKK